MKNCLRIVPAMMLALFMAAPAQAVPLSTLLNGGSITAGDKRFDDWSVISYSSSTNGRVFSAANIDVTALNDGGLDPGPGLRFTVSGGELTVTGDGLFAFVDLKFGFHVQVLDPSLRIKDNSLRITAASNLFVSDGDNDLGSFIHEDAGTSAGASDLSMLNAEDSVLDDAPIVSLPDSATFAPQSEIWVTKNILVWAVDATDTASLTGFEQRFSQTADVPEPASSALFGVALAAALLTPGLRRRRWLG